MRVYGARWLLPVTSPPVRDGAVAVSDGSIFAAGGREEVLQAAGEAASLVELGDAAVLPGLVNAHTHVELSWMGEDRPRGDDFPRWVRGLIERRGREQPERAKDAAETAIDFMTRRGTVAIGDVSNQTWVVPLLARSSLCGVAFHEIYGFDDEDAENLLAAAETALAALAQDPDVARGADRWRIVATPHAPHTTSSKLIRALAARVAAHGGPLSIHVAESEAEASLLRDATGAFVELFRERGIWNDSFVPPRTSPIEHLDRIGALTGDTLAVHCVRASPSDRSRLQQRGASVVSCPRSNRLLGVGLAPIPQLMSSGLLVALGTDSLASAPDLDLLAEMAAMREEHPSLSAPAVLRMATFNGAAALGLSDRFGSIEPGKSDRLVVVPLPPNSEDPAGVVCSCPTQIYSLEDAPTGEGER
jgi:cytosine/adenosine deaminase-related metal-dependent hydrolase